MSWRWYFAALLAVGLGCGPISESGRAKVTMGNISTLGGMCLQEHPHEVSQEALRRLAKGYRYSDDEVTRLLADGWGNPLVVRRTLSSDGSPSYRIESWGSDGQQGACCSGRVEEDYAQDCVWQDGQWLQFWVGTR